MADRYIQTVKSILYLKYFQKIVLFCIRILRPRSNVLEKSISYTVLVFLSIFVCCISNTIAICYSI